jgi:hypothetical protein
MGKIKKEKRGNMTFYYKPRMQEVGRKALEVSSTQQSITQQV